MPAKKQKKLELNARGNDTFTSRISELVGNGRNIDENLKMQIKLITIEFRLKFPPMLENSIVTGSEKSNWKRSGKGNISRILGGKNCRQSWKRQSKFAMNLIETRLKIRKWRRKGGGEKNQNNNKTLKIWNRGKKERFPHFRASCLLAVPAF